MTIDTPSTSDAQTIPTQRPKTDGRRRFVRGWLLPLILTAAGVAVGVYWHQPLSQLVGLGRESVGGEGAGTNGARTEAAKRLWTCSMHPQVIQDKPGLCPICHMQLVPLNVDQSAKAGSSQDGTTTPSGAAPRDSSGPTRSPREVAYWWDPMSKPPYMSSKPGKSPMGMDLVPVFKDEVSGGTAITIDPVVVQNMGVRVTAAVEAPIQRTLRAVGYLVEPEPSRVDINLRVSGWIENLFADTQGMRLKKGDRLFELYSPDLQVAVEEAIVARRAATGAKSEAISASADAAYTASRQKLHLLGLSDDLVDELAAREQAPRTVTFRSPIDGLVYEKAEVYTGSAVKAGDRVMRLSDNSRLWLDAQVFERDLSHIAVGSRVVATTEFMPGKRFSGEVTFIHPHLDPATRTALVRVTVENPSLELRQGMYATIEAALDVAATSVVIPRDAVLDTGQRQIVFLALAGGKFEPRRVEVGMESDDGRVQILAGLAPGETVVTSGQFLLDSESRLKEAVQKFLESKQRASALPAPVLSKTAYATGESPSSKADRLAVVSPEQQAALDDLFRAYLALAGALGASSPPDPLDIGPLVASSGKAHEGGPSGLAAQLHAVVEAVGELKGKPIGQQREAFKRMSVSVIALADLAPPTANVSSKLYVVRCPMAHAVWLQTSDTIANPYYAEDMKECGQVVGVIEPSRAGRSGN